MLLKEKETCRKALWLVDNSVVEKISESEGLAGGVDSWRMPFADYDCACITLKNDLDYLLVISDDEPAVVRERLEESFAGYGEAIRGLVQKIYEDALERALIRRDFSSALSKVERGEDLSWTLGYGLSRRDLSELAKLHRDNKFRDKIAELLTDCNFHKECADFIDGKWDGYI